MLSTVSGKKSWPGLIERDATTVASTTVSSMFTSTAPLAWRAISPVSITTVWSPHWKVLVTLLKIPISPPLLNSPVALGRNAPADGVPAKERHRFTLHVLHVAAK